MNPLMPAPSNPTEQRARSNSRPSVVTTNHAARGIPDVKRSPLRFRNCLVHRSGFANPDRAGRERAKYGSTMLIQTNRWLTCPGRTCNEWDLYRTRYPLA